MNFHEDNSQIRLISECYVKPRFELEASKQPYYLGIIDTVVLPFDQIQKGLLFATKPKDMQCDLLEKLNRSLSIALIHFYPLAGRLATEKFPDEHAIWIYLDCNKGPGARLTHAVVDVTVSDLLSSVDVHPIVRSFFDLGEKAINYDGHNRPLLSIQVSELIDGVFIGFTMNHSVVDGNSQWHFISSLSEIFLQLDKFIENHENDDKPVFKTYFPDGYGPVIKLPILEPDEFVTVDDPGPLRERIFHFSSASLSKLKAMANEDCGIQNISSFQALSALMWRSITRARKRQPDEDTSCSLIINARRRFKPPLSDDYFGNMITREQCTCQVGELLEKCFGWAAMLVHQVVVSQDDKAIPEFYVRFAKARCFIQPGTTPELYAPNLVVIGGSSRFDMYGPEFGLGKAEAVLAGYCGKEDGKITASPGREGGGSVDLEVCLRPEGMNALELDEDFMRFVTLA